MNVDDPIKKGLICKYCGRNTELINSSEIYNGQSYGYLYICKSCNAYVGCHKGTTEAMGSVANAELRKLRHLAHEWFDSIWKNKLKKSRYNAYSWLSLKMELNKNFTHMGLFDEAQCKKVIQISSDYIKQKAPDLWTELNKRLSD